MDDIIFEYELADTRGGSLSRITIHDRTKDAVEYIPLDRRRGSFGFRDPERSTS